MCKVTLYINVVCRCLISPVVSLGRQHSLYQKPILRMLATQWIVRYDFPSTCDFNNLNRFLQKNCL